MRSEVVLADRFVVLGGGVAAQHLADVSEAVLDTNALFLAAEVDVHGVVYAVDAGDEVGVDRDRVALT